MNKYSLLSICPMFIKLIYWGGVTVTVFIGILNISEGGRCRKGIYIPLKVRKIDSKKNLKNHNKLKINVIYRKLLHSYLEYKTIFHFLQKRKIGQNSLFR